MTTTTEYIFIDDETQKPLFLSGKLVKATHQKLQSIKKLKSYEGIKQNYDGKVYTLTKMDALLKALLEE